jgi:elongation factor Tu
MGWLRRKPDESMNAQDLLARAHAADPAPGPAGGLRMTVGDVFSIRGRGTVVTGRIEAGAVRVGDTVRVNGARPVSVDGIEMFRKTVETAGVGDNVGLLVRQLGREDVDRGDVISN